MKNEYTGQAPASSGSKSIFFITFLRAVAACIITNAHYTGVYPTDLIANGGLLGDVLFFAVSGYCLYHVKGSFPVWYGKRILRVYTPVWVITGVYLLLGAYTLTAHNAAWWLLYPTNYHFVASIILLYIPFYVCMRIDALRNHIPWVMAAVAAGYLLVYLLWYDKTTYHIDNVYQPMIRFLFMESMLLGAWFRQHDARLRNTTRVALGWYAAATVAMLGLYFVSKLWFSRHSAWAEFQVVNQVVLFAALALVFRLFCALDARLERLPRPLKAVIAYLAEITLEIYVVQYVLIDVLRPLCGFPFNWLLLTGSILAAASALHIVCRFLLRWIDRGIAALSNKWGKKV